MTTENFITYITYFKRITRLSHHSLYTYRNCNNRNFYHLLYLLIRVSHAWVTTLTCSSGNNSNCHFLVPTFISLTYKRITRVRHLSLYTYRNCNNKNFCHLFYLLISESHDWVTSLTRPSGNNINSHWLILFYLLISGSHECVTCHCIHTEMVTTEIFITYFTYL